MKKQASPFIHLRIAFFLAYKQITRGNKGSLFLTIGIMSLVFLNIAFIGSLMAGSEKTSIDQLINNQTSHIKIEPKDDELYIKNVKDIQSKINHHHSVIGTSAHYKTAALFTYDKHKDQSEIKEGNWTITSVVPKDEIKISTILDSIVAGSFLDKNDRDMIVLGRDISGGFNSNFPHDALGGKKGLKIGSNILLTFSNGIEKEYTVKGIFNTKDILSDGKAFITKKEMENILEVSDLASEILVKTIDRNQAQKYAEDFKSMGIKNVKIHPWTNFMGLIESMTGSTRLIKKMLTSIGLGVSGVTIFIIIFIRVTNKRKEIGILKAIGMNETTIIYSYLFQVLFYAFCGLGGGLLILYFGLSTFFSIHPIEFPMGAVKLEVIKKDVIINGASLIISSIIAGFIPAWQTARKSILNLIWGS